MSDVEATARLICRALRLNPDAELVGGYEGPRRFQWESFVAEANIILEATPKPDSPTGYGEACDSCGRSYEITYRVPDDIWLKIAPRPEAIGDHPEHALGGLLCPDCASSRAKALGVTLRFNADTDWPDSPVCVEVMPLIWSEVKEWPDDVVPPAEEWRGATSDPRHSYQVSRAIGVREWRASIDGGAWFPSRKAAIAACDAYHERRSLELVNARSVESVKAERDRELIEIFAAKTQEIDQSDANGRALALSYINAVQCLRSLTEGEG